MMPNWDSYFGPRTIPIPESGCIVWDFYLDTAGYGRLGAAWTGETFAHRVSWVLANGAIPDGMKVLHRCDVRSCVNPHHLFLGTQADNVADMLAKGRARFAPPQHGAENPMAVLDEANVWAIRQMLRHGIFTQRQIADDYGVAPMTISRIANNQTWRHVHAE